jgi:hypothetical protein
MQCGQTSIAVDVGGPLKKESVNDAGAAEGCDLLIFDFKKNKIKRSQPSAAPTRGEHYSPMTAL